MKKEIIRTVKYGLVAVSAGIIQILTFTLLNEITRLNYWASYLIALVLSVLWNFTLNRRYKYKSTSDIKKQYIRLQSKTSEGRFGVFSLVGIVSVVERKTRRKAMIAGVPARSMRLAL